MRPDQAGKFTVDDLPAGSYLAVSAPAISNGAWADPPSSSSSTSSAFASRWYKAKSKSSAYRTRPYASWDNEGRRSMTSGLVSLPLATTRDNPILRESSGAAFTRETDREGACGDSAIR